jgi:hypothetical protein
MNDLGEHGHGDDYVEACDCHRCALEFRNRYKKALASISEEMGLPPTMCPPPGALKSALDAAKNAIDRIRDAPKAVSQCADFERMTWTLRIVDGGRTGGSGVYAMVWIGENVSVEHGERK